MDKIPDYLRMKMMVDAVILLKDQLGWNLVHYNITKSSLYLKKTTNLLLPRDMVYESILRANTLVYFAYGKTFTWLKQSKHKPDLYYYSPQYINVVQDLYSTDSYGYFLDDG
tara:strand:- start:2153 stop:2488 length:336 start_codon:yes stop_codon:yes gene_type:complete